MNEYNNFRQLCSAQGSVQGNGEGRMLDTFRVTAIERAWLVEPHLVIAGIGPALRRVFLCTNPPLPL